MSNNPEGNVFRIVEPDNWICTIDSFSSTHNILSVELKNATNKSKRLYLRFRKVRYFTGWMNWIGANFGVGSDDECYQLLNKGIAEEHHLDEEAYRFSNLRLFQVHGNDGKQIQIIANAGGCYYPDGNVLSTFPDLQ